MSIEESYCLQMDKITTTSQARVAFLSSENTIYSEFSFYCIDCGMRLSGANVHKKEELTRKNKTTHYKIYTNKERHTVEKCKKHNPGYKSSMTRETGKKVINGDLIVYTKFKLSQIDYEIVQGLKDKSPSSLEIEKMEFAVYSSIECDIHTTSILKDLVNCFSDLKEKDELENHPLIIEGDILPDNTYSSVFRKIIEFNDKSKNRRKLNEHNDNFFKFRVLYGKSKNDFIEKENIGWSFLVDFINTYEKEKYFFRKIIDGEVNLKAMLVRVFIPTETLKKYSKLSDQYINDEKNKILNSFYITNCTPSVQKWNNNKANGTHEELIFEIKNLNHIHLTFIKKQESI